MPKITLPFNFEPRHYQVPVLAALDGGSKRAVAVWHRRSGKEKTFINYTAKKCFERIGSYFYVFPTYRQAKKAIWDGMDRNGFPFLGHFPKEIIQSRDATELKLTLANGSIFQLVGSDNIDALMSTNPIGIVFAEYSLQDPRAWDYMRPILKENGGWAIFDYTPRGKNHGYTLYNMAKKLMDDGDPDWFAQKLGINETGVLNESDMETERREGMSEDMIQQEYYCSFEGVQQGAIFGKQMEEAERAGRICGVPWQTEFSVDTWWDIGTGDPTAIWFTQNIGREIHVIDYYENSGVGVGIDHYVKHLQGMPYVWGTHNGPHDIEAHSFAANGKSTLEVARNLGLKFVVVPRCDHKQDSINAARAIIPRCWFDAKKTERGRLALVSYQYLWDEKRKTFSSVPWHSWASNGADAFQQLGMGHKTAVPKRDRGERRQVFSEGEGAQGWLAA